MQFKGILNKRLKKLPAANSEAAAEKKPEVKDPPTDKQEQDKNPKREACRYQWSIEKSIAQQLKDKHGLEFSDEEILDILKKTETV
jgi:hypothetical protein